jgi:hypothetical protein
MKIFITDLSVVPIAFKIAISGRLSITTMIRFAVMEKAATNMITINIMNITNFSNFIALNKALFLDRDNTIKELVDRASSRHYSAFFLYEQDEFDYALKKFETNLKENYSDPESIKWLDEKILYIIKKS